MVVINYSSVIHFLLLGPNLFSRWCCCPCRFAGEIISDGEANVRDNDSYMFNLENKVSDVVLTSHSV